MNPAEEDSHKNIQSEIPSKGISGNPFIVIE
jgi:hypothetical protein